MRIKASLLSLAACSCIGFNIIPTTDDTSSTGGGDSGSSSSDASDATVAPEAAAGIECGVDPDTGVTLCVGIASCPSVPVDQDLFPGCGYRIHADPTVLDLECSCYGQICPIGIASTCDQATALMQDQSQYTVCMQVNEGRCTTN